MNLLVLILVVLVGVTWAQENFTETTKDKVVNECNKTSKTLEKIVTETQNCMLGYFSVDDIKTRVEVGRNNEVLDIVSEEFCLVKSIIQRCVNRSLSMEDSCTSRDEQEGSRLLLDITKSVLNFVCYKHGDRIFMFLAEGGFECIENKTNELENCVNANKGDTNFTDLTIENFYNQINNVTICERYNKLQGCVFDVLQTCTAVVPADIVNSLFVHIKSFTTC